MKILKFRTAEDSGSPPDNGPDNAADDGAHKDADTKERKVVRNEARGDAGDDVGRSADHNDSNDRSTTKDSSKSVDVKTPGSRLRAARTSRNLTIEQVASELNLSRDTIAAIEEEDYDALPEKTYVQGYLKSYARLVDVSETDVIGASVNPTLIEPEAKAIKPARVLPEPKRPGSGLGVMLLGLVGLMIAAAVWMGYQQEWFSMSSETAAVGDTVRLGPGTTATDNTITASRTVEPIAAGSQQSVTFGKRKTVEVVSGQIPAAADSSVTTSTVAVESDTPTDNAVVTVAPTVTDVEVNTTDPTRPAYNPEVVVIPAPAAAVTTPSQTEGGEVVETIIETVTISPTGEEIKTVEVIAGDGTVTVDGNASSIDTVVETTSDEPEASVSSDSAEETQTTETSDESTVTEADSESDSSAQSDDDASAEERVINPAWPEIVLTGSGDSWVEIVDATGEKVFVQMVKNDQSYRVQGEPPLSLLIGNAPAVELTFDGKEIDVQDSASSSNVARITLGE